ncbi:MAG: hypothetical protein NVS9B15_04590 [Acidobacteriaceae bacterium]
MAASCVLPSAAQAMVQATDSKPLKYLVQLRYWAKPGKADEVYRVRVQATAVLERLGAPHGSLLRGSGEGSPDVIWQGEFPDRESARKPHFAAKTDPEFKKVSEEMAPLCSRIEGSFYQEVIPTSVE